MVSFYAVSALSFFTKTGPYFLLQAKLLEEMDSEFGVSSVIQEAMGDIGRKKIKKEPVTVFWISGWKF